MEKLTNKDDRVSCHVKLLTEDLTSSLPMLLPTMMDTQAS